MSMLNTAFESQIKLADEEDDGEAEADSDEEEQTKDSNNHLPVNECQNSTEEDTAVGGASTAEDRITAMEEHNESRATDSDHESETDDFPEALDNHEQRPFRDEPEHINAHIMRNIQRGRSADSICSASTATSVAPEVIKARVKKQFVSEEKRQQARRTRKHGEAAVQTRKRRENFHDVKTSLDAGWY